MEEEEINIEEKNDVLILQFYLVLGIYWERDQWRRVSKVNETIKITNK
jgi:hypothetical protein